MNREKCAVMIPDGATTLTDLEPSTENVDSAYGVRLSKLGLGVIVCWPSKKTTTISAGVNIRKQKNRSVSSAWYLTADLIDCLWNRAAAVYSQDLFGHHHQSWARAIKMTAKGQHIYMASLCTQVATAALILSPSRLWTYLQYQNG